MYQIKINKTEVDILQLILHNPLSEKDIANELDLSPSWTSECITHLASIGFIYIEKKGISNFSQIIKNSFGESLKLLLTEKGMLNLKAILPDSGLVILPLLLQPGSNLNEISCRTGLTKRTIHNKLHDWKSMGLIKLNKYPEVIVLKERDPYLQQFLIEFCKTRNRLFLSKKYPKAVIVWEWRDEFIFTTNEKMDDNIFLKAGVTGLEEFTNELVHNSEYYYYCTYKKVLSLEEILIQSIRIDPINPRQIRIIRNQMEEGNIDKKILFTHAKKYDIHKSLKERL